MSYSKEFINGILENVAKKIDINENMFKIATSEYEQLGKYIKRESDYEVSIYPQGSLSLGTTIKPISENDDYDVDFVCEFVNDYGIDAKQLKSITGKWLNDYRKTDRLEEKKRCWHVEYNEMSNFHLDVVPGYKYNNMIKITNKIGNNYNYILSNPKGYKEWFDLISERSKKVLLESTRFSDVSNSAIKPIERNKKTIIQMAIQILKRHRDIMFKDNKNIKPISAIISTIVCQLYKNENNIYDIIISFINNADKLIKNNMINGQYYIMNPACKSDNFADKWNEYPERAEAFFNWINKLKDNFDYAAIAKLDRLDAGKLLMNSLGENVGKMIINEMANNDKRSIKEGTLKVGLNDGSLSKNGSIAIPSNHHYE